MCNSGYEHNEKPRRRRHIIRTNPERGWTQFLFLRLIHEKSMHGYQIMEELNSRNFLQENRLEAGSVYTILRRMEHHGLIKSKWEEIVSGPDRRIYTITPEGSEILKSGLEIMIKRKELLDDLSDYYKKNFQSKME
ncbi:PadR family transcriptional regulator [Candidatus Bathyarchaeota archaeon]|nr:PadR family transcriptional regulator [Candidatus Bathyarchaeota archaeon]